MSKNNKNRKTPAQKQRAREARAAAAQQEAQRAKAKGWVRLAVLITAVISVLMMSTTGKILVMDRYVRAQGVELPGILTAGLIGFILLDIAAQVLLVMLYLKWQFKPWAGKLVTLILAVLMITGIGMDYAWNTAYQNAADGQTLPAVTASQSADAA